MYKIEDYSNNSHGRIKSFQRITVYTINQTFNITGLPRSWKNHGILKFSGISGKVMEKESQVGP